MENSIFTLLLHTYQKRYVFLKKMDEISITKLELNYLMSNLVNQKKLKFLD